MSYSPFFAVLHDDTAPVGSIGRGSHYSVLRAPIWHDAALEPQPEASVIDFAVVWDEDHDTRVFDAIHEIYQRGLLAPVRFIGERKGSLTVLLSDNAFRQLRADQIALYRRGITEIGQSLSDPWPATVDRIDGADHQIIQASSIAVGIYLRNIDLLWNLGIKPWRKALRLDGSASGQEDRFPQATLLELTLDKFNFSVRVINALTAANIFTLGELISRSEWDLSRVVNLGDRSLDEIKAKLRSHELSLRPDMSPPGL